MAPAQPYSDRELRERIVRILVGGARFDRRRLSDATQAVAWQQALDAARHTYGHALCECRHTPLKLQIRLRDGHYHVAVWPEEGPKHDSNCLFFREEGHLTGSSSQVAHAIPAHQERPSPEVTSEIRYSLNRAEPKPPRIQARIQEQNSSAGAPADQRAKPAMGASLPGLLHMLWNEAQLARWHPAWSRDWGRARYELLQLADRLSADGEKLSERIFIPRPYRPHLKDKLNREWDDFMGRVSRHSEATTRGALVIAPVRKLVQLPTGNWSIHLRHMINPIGINAATYDFLRSNCGTSLNRIQDLMQANERAAKAKKGDLPPGWIEPGHPEVVAVLHVLPSTRGGLWTMAAWLMPVHPTTFIPAMNHDEVILIDALVAGGHQFNRLLSEERAASRTTPEWIVRHVLGPTGEPVARASLSTVFNAGDKNHMQARQAIAKALSQKGIPTWTWTPQGRLFEHKVPPLPPRDDAPKELARSTLACIRLEPQVTYEQ